MSASLYEPHKGELERLLRHLNSQDDVLHAEALRRARALPPESLLELAQIEAQTYRKRNRMTGYFILVLTLVALVVLFAYHRLGFWKPEDHLSPLAYFSGFILYVSLLVRERYVPTRARHSLASIIEETQDLRFLSILLALQKEMKADPTVTRSVYNALRRLVPQIVHGDSSGISVSERIQALLLILGAPYKDVELTLSVLKALEQIGDESAIPAVTELAETSAATPGMKRIQQAARECLPYLHIHADEMRQARTLLRASNPAFGGTDDLLRPSTPMKPYPHPEQLLRPPQPEDNLKTDEDLTP